ncbi:MAG: hypothetical protein JWM21_1338 [Acidobacteria bacterium]|nr:hypothetical protein [Acidobacteriota bacterium]
MCIQIPGGSARCLEHSEDAFALKRGCGLLRGHTPAAEFSQLAVASTQAFVMAEADGFGQLTSQSSVEEAGGGIVIGVGAFSRLRDNLIDNSFLQQMLLGEIPPA